MKCDTPKHLPTSSCSNCWRPLGYCLCENVRAVRNRLRILILQHPREALEGQSTGRTLSLSLTHGTHRIGLSWPSLKAALGEPVSPSQWGVLYVGGLQSKESEQVLPGQLQGLVVLDGTWKQSKTLWWRNPWLMRLKRVRLSGGIQSNYFPLRKEPRKDCLSSLEAVSDCLARAGEKEVAEHLQRTFRYFLTNTFISMPGQTSGELRSKDSPVA